MGIEMPRIRRRFALFEVEVGVWFVVDGEEDDDDGDGEVVPAALVSDVEV